MNLLLKVLLIEDTKWIKLKNKHNKFNKKLMCFVKELNIHVEKLIPFYMGLTGFFLIM